MINTPNTKAENGQLKAERRVRSMIKRALKFGERAGELYGKQFELLQLAQQNGLALNVPVEIDGVKWQLIEPEGKFVRFAKLALKRVPKLERKSASTAQPA